MSSEIYNKIFFDFMNGCRTNYRALADCIWLACGPDIANIIDLGCGTGLVIERLQELSGATCTGYDAFGTSDNPNVVIRHIDLSVLQVFSKEVDLVICTETGEHLPTSSSAALVTTIVSAAKKMIVFSAAPPAQDTDAVGHINCQPYEFWLNAFALLGWIVDGQRTSRLRKLMLDTHAQHEYCTDNFHILVRPNG